MAAMCVYMQWTPEQYWSLTAPEEAAIVTRINKLEKERERAARRRR